MEGRDNQCGSWGVLSRKSTGTRHGIGRFLLSMNRVVCWPEDEMSKVSSALPVWSVQTAAATVQLLYVVASYLVHIDGPMMFRTLCPTLGSIFIFIPFQCATYVPHTNMIFSVLYTVRRLDTYITYYLAGIIEMNRAINNKNILL